MTATLNAPRAAVRLRASPSFVLAFSQDGRPYVAKETEPYIQYWLTPRYRTLLSLFSGRRGATGVDAVDAYFRLSGTAPQEAERKRLLKAVDDMREAGVLIGARDDVSRYDARIAQDYLRHRPFPAPLADLIIREAPVRPHSRVLDLAGGPGSLALALARASGDVSLMDLSRAFVTTARTQAVQQGVQLKAIHESCNRLMYSDDEYDVVTISQALHWLDDVLVCRGVCRVLRPEGSFFVIHAAMDVDDAHPLGHVLGNDSILGRKDPQPFASQVRSLLRRLTLLFEALDAPDVQRHDPAQRWYVPGDQAAARIAACGASFFRQQRPFDLGYARAFFTPRHIEATGKSAAEFWRDVETRCAAATTAQLMGRMDWAVLHFRRTRSCGQLPAIEDQTVVDIGWQAPA